MYSLRNLLLVEVVGDDNAANIVGSYPLYNNTTKPSDKCPSSISFLLLRIVLRTMMIMKNIMITMIMMTMMST